MPLPNTTTNNKNPFRSRSGFFQPRRKLQRYTNSSTRSHLSSAPHHGGRRAGGYTSTAVRLKKLIRAVGTIVSFTGIICIVYFQLWDDWVLPFLNGPQHTSHKRSSSNVRSIADLAASHSDGYRPPEAPRPPRKDVFHRLNRKEKEALDVMKTNFESLQNSNNNKLLPCRLDNGDCDDKQQPSHPSSISFFRSGNNNNQNSGSLLLHNSLPEDRYWCGKRIMGNGGTLQLDTIPKECAENAIPYVYTSHPPLMVPLSTASASAPPRMESPLPPPVELFWNTDDYFYGEDDVIVGFGSDPGSTGTKKNGDSVNCSVPCLSSGNFDILNTINVRNTKWEIVLTMEGKQYYSEAQVRAGAYRDSRFYATTSFHSEIPVPYFSWAEYNIQHPAVNFDNAIKGASFLANNCGSHNRREELVENLTKSELRVDALSECLHNAEPPPGVDMSNKTDVLKEYLFHLAFENQREEDYITEKLWGALASGTLPVYFGAPNIKEHIPPNSIVVVDNFDTVEDLAQHLVTLTMDRRLYESYHAWRYQPIEPSFKRKYAFTNTHSTCRMCKFAYATRHGLSWNQSRQEVVDPSISHKTCRNKIGLVGHPFKEYWFAANGQDAAHVSSEEAQKTCTITHSNRRMDVDHGAVRRKVFDHDGVTDLIIDMDKTGKYVLKLETPIFATDFFEFNENIRWMQDGQSRMTVLISEGATATIANQEARSVLQITVSSSLRIRIIVEDVDHFHKGARKVPTYFGDLMARDFFAPVEAYIT